LLRLRCAETAEHGRTWSWRSDRLIVSISR